MVVAKFFNKGLVKGVVTRSEIVEYENKKGKSHFLAMEVDTGDNNKIKVTMFPTTSNPNKAREIVEQFPNNSMVEVSGKVQEKEFETKTGQKGVDRSISAISIRPLKEKDNDKLCATFIIQGIVEKVREVADGGAIVIVRYDDSYTPKGSSEKVIKSEAFTLSADEDMLDTMENVDCIKGCNAKFKGKIFNTVEYDDYGDIVGNVRKFQLEIVSDVIDSDDLEEPEQMSFI